MSKVTIYHNPRCSKSRQTLGLINEQGIEPDIIEYLKDAPSADELQRLCLMLGKKPLEIMRTREARFSELKLSTDDERADIEWCQIMSDNPILIERPIVVNDNKAALGRPPEQVLDIL